MAVLATACTLAGGLTAAAPQAVAAAPKAPVSGLTGSLSSYSAGATEVTYTVGFTTSPTGALAENKGTIDIEIPGDVFSGPCGGAIVTDLTTRATSQPTLDVCAYFKAAGSTDQVDIPAPFVIHGSNHVEVAISDLSNPVRTGADTVTVGTSADAARSTTFRLVPAGRVSDVSVSRSDDSPGAALVTYTIGFTTSPGGALVAGPSAATSGTIDIKVPPSTFDPECGGDAIIDLTTHAKSAFPLNACGYWTAGPNQVALPTSFPIGGDNHVEVVISNLENPARPGLHMLTIGTSSDLARHVGYLVASPSQVVGHVSVALTSAAVRATEVTYTVGFTPSAAGGLTANVSTLTLDAPLGTFSAEEPCAKAVATFTDLATKASGTEPLCEGGVAAVTGGGSQVTVAVPIAIAAGQPAQVVITGLDNPAVPGPEALSVSTSKDASTSVTYSFRGKGIPIEAASVRLSTAGAEASRVTYTVEFKTSRVGGLAAGSGGIALTGPVGTFPVSPACYQDVATITDLVTNATGKVDLCNASEDQNGSQLVLVTPVAIGGGQHVEVVITGLNNPTAPGAKALVVSTTSNTARGAGYRIIPGSRVSAASVVVSNRAAGATLVTDAVALTIPATGALASGSGTITLYGPPGVFPSPADCTQATAAVSDLTTKISAPVATCAEAAGGAPGSLGLFVPLTVNGGDRIVVTVSGLANPTRAGPQMLRLVTSSNGVPVSMAFTTLPAGVISGDVGDTSDNSVDGGAVQACPTRGGPCADAITATNGAFRLVVPGGDYALSVYPPATGGLSPTTAARVLRVTTRSDLTGVNFTLRVLDPLPGKVSIGGQDSGVPEMYAFHPTTMVVHSCPYGFGDVMVRGTNVETDKKTVLIYPLLEPQPGSGRYVETMPPVWPVHGFVSVSYSIYCAEAIAPKAGPSGGGNVVTIHGKGFTGATAVDFGTTPASRFKVLSNTLAQAVAPPGSGTVTVSVRTPKGTIRGGALTSYGYASMTSVTPSYGPSSGSTAVLVRGSNLNNGLSFWFGGRPATDVHVISDKEVSVVTPPGSGRVPLAIGQIDYFVPGGLNPSTPRPALYFRYGSARGPSRGPDAAPVREAAAKAAGVAGQAPRLNMTPQLVGVGAKPALAVADGQPVQYDSFGEYSPLPTTPGAGGSSSTSGGGWGFSISGKTLTDISTVTTLLAGLAGFGTAVVTSATTITLGAAIIPVLPAIIGFGVGLAIVAAAAAIAANHVGPDGNFSAYFDPSGTVSATDGAPIAGATAVLEQAPTADGPFSAPPADSPAITPHVNPQVTTANGQFHWDVIADYYKVVATAPGCHAPGDPAQASVSTPVMLVPPPRSGLDLVLQCAHEAAPARPAVSSLSLDAVPTTGGEQIEVIGTGFTPSAQVRFGTVSSKAVTYLSPELLEATVPPGEGDVHVLVTTSGGTSAAGPGGALSYHPAPMVTAISPATGPVTGGTRVTVYGSGLASAELVTVGDVVLTKFTVEADGNIELTVPAAKAGPVPIKVTTPYGTNVPYVADMFTYVVPKPPTVPTTEAPR